MMAIWRWLYRALRSDDLDLYLMVAVATIFTVLGIIGVDPKWVAACVLALLALLAISQIRSRHQVSRIAEAQQLDPLGRLRTNFPEDLEARRANAMNVLLIGVSLSRTIQTYRRDAAATLARGGAIRILLLDPATILDATGETARLRGRIETSLNELVALRDRHARLEIRLLDREPSSGMNVLNPGAPDGLIVVQYFEFNPNAESAPILALQNSDAPWYSHFRDEAERLWESGRPWPEPDGKVQARRVSPNFTLRFGSEYLDAMSEAGTLLITGVSRNELVFSNFHMFQSALQRGCKLRIVLVDPGSAALDIAADRYYAERSSTYLQSRILQTASLLSTLKERTGGSVELRYTKHPLAVGCVAVDVAPDHTQGSLYLEYYTHQAANEPKFVLHPADVPAFQIFLEEAEMLWESADEVNLGPTTSTTASAADSSSVSSPNPTNTRT